MVKWRDGKYHMVRVIERRRLSAHAPDYEYYVHYIECETHFPSAGDAIEFR